MAMINYPECGKEISSQANNCPHCGCPISERTNDIEGKNFPEPLEIAQIDTYLGSCSTIRPWDSAICLKRLL